MCFNPVKVSFSGFAILSKIICVYCDHFWGYMQIFYILFTNYLQDELIFLKYVPTDKYLLTFIWYTYLVIKMKYKHEVESKTIEMIRLFTHLVFCMEDCVFKYAKTLLIVVLVLICTMMDKSKVYGNLF